jgi:hypothetical protein
MTANMRMEHERGETHKVEHHDRSKEPSGYEKSAVPHPDERPPSDFDPAASHVVNNEGTLEPG